MTPDQIALSVQSADKKRCLDKLDWYSRQFMARLTSIASLLKELRDDPLKPWRAKEMTFEEFCRETFHLTSSRVRQITDGEDLRSLLALEAPELKPAIAALNERQTRELTAVAPAKRADVFRAAVSADPKPKARTIREAKARILGEKPRAKIEPLDDFALASRALSQSGLTALRMGSAIWRFMTPEERVMLVAFQSGFTA